MAPTYPEEVDVFTVPHSRMKELVHTYLERVSYANFCDVDYMTGVLEKLCHTFHVFKAHEQIENRFIMGRLREKLTALDITDAAVCNCHSDNRLTEMLSLVLDGYRWAQREEGERVKYGLRLRRALEDFTQVFIPHMKEEEEVFQPMLVEYFTYDELRELKVKVIQQHLHEEEEASGKEDASPESQSHTGKEEDKEEEEEVEASLLEQLPTELVLKILGQLSPRDLMRCAQVSQHMNHVAMDPSLWRTVLPVQWAAGNWTWHFDPTAEDDDDGNDNGGGYGSEGEGEAYSYSRLRDEDADKDESSDSDASDSPEGDTMNRALREVRVLSGVVRHLLGRVGSGVERMSFGRSRGLSSSLLHRVLKLCPNLKVLSLAHTRITDAAFREYGLKGRCCLLEHLDLSGCQHITDSTLHSLAGTPASSHSAAEDPASLHTPTPMPTLTCCGRGCSPRSVPPSTTSTFSPTTVLVELSVRDPDPDPSTPPSVSDPIIIPDHPDIDLDIAYTDVPLELCEALSCLELAGGTLGGGVAGNGLGGILVPTPREGRLILREAPGGGCVPAQISPERVRRDGSGDCVVVSSCCSPSTERTKTCCSSSGATTAPSRDESNRDCVVGVVEKQRGGGCCGGSGGDGGISERCGDEEDVEEDEEEEAHALHNLTHLSLNGCYRITDDGLQALWERGGLPELQYLDLSGCVNVSGKGVGSLVDTCPSLDHQFLFYCDNMRPDPFPTTASGCRNLECNSAFCCRSGD